MKILVTGCLGFIGTNLIEKLLENDNYNITGIDNLDNFYNIDIKLKNYENIKSDKFNYIHSDLSEKDFFEKLYFEKFDVIIHLAGISGVRNSEKNSLKYVKNNIIASHNIIEYAKITKSNKIIFSSSSTVYGNVNKISKEEDLLNPISFYGKTKKMVEEMLELNSSNELKINILRLFSVYGKYQRPDLVLSKFFNKIHLDNEIDVYGNGTTTRDYTHVNDVVDAIIACFKDVENFRIFNIGSSSPIQLNKLIDIINLYLNKDIKINYIEKQFGDVDNTYADITKAKQILNWKSKISIFEGVKMYYEWYENNLNYYSSTFYYSSSFKDRFSDINSESSPISDIDKPYLI